jgi:MFS family permease
VVAVAVFPTVPTTLLLAVTGFSFGVTGSSWDLIVRAAAPLNASGKVFGFVYSGLDCGSAITPLVFGWLLDHGHPRTVFVASSVLFLLTLVTIPAMRRGARLRTSPA